MTIDSAGAVEISNTIDGNGNGQITYSTHYEEGTFWLSKDGDWGDGVADITGTLTDYDIITTVTYVIGMRVGASSSITATGVLDNCRMRDAVLEFAVATAIQVWHPDDPVPMPGGYPPLLCGATTGELFDVACITISFQPALPVEEHSWGVVKALYR